MTVASKKAVKLPAKTYEPTPQESQAVTTYMAGVKAKPAVPGIKVVQGKDGSNQLALNHPDTLVASCLLLEAVGTKDPDFLGGILGQLANVASKGQTVDEAGLNFMVSMVKGVAPRDQVEAMLAVQMAAVHDATMTLARRLNKSETIPQQDSAERAFNKLARTFTAQVEALKRYRSAGEQTVRVEHVTVNDGGQAIVGNVTHGGVAQKKPEATS
jgi:hypothetical protein